MIRKPLPVGVDDFEKLIRNGYYYVDKTLFIRELLDKKGDVSLFTRPRRFGKTLTLSMLKCFFENTGSEERNCENKKLFEGLSIYSCGSIYTEQMGKYPVISISLKSAKQPDFPQAFYAVQEAISQEYKRHEPFLEDMDLNPQEKQRYIRMTRMEAVRGECNTSLRFLSECLSKIYSSNVIILLDEYDVPLKNAYFSGFYNEMAEFLRSLFESVLKTNPFLEFAVMTGCLRISKESIFTGLNNLDINSILAVSYGEYFGFTQEEVDRMLQYYGLEEKKDIMRHWYDGYRFGDEEVYNPWSVVKFTKDLCADREAFPSPYWANPSSNSIVRGLVERADISVRGELEALIEGSTIEKPVHEDITYGDVYQSEDNLWNFLFFTGYLRQTDRRMVGEDQYIEMAIPNAEVRYIYKNTILSWFDQKVRNMDLGVLYEAIEHGNFRVMEEEISSQLQETISFYDYAKSYYHGFLTGLLKNIGKYRILSNRESGKGRPDIILKTPSIRGRAVILEIKVSAKFSDMEKACASALRQIKEQKYDAELRDEGYTEILKYGISFYKKECMVRM